MVSRLSAGRPVKEYADAIGHRWCSAASVFCLPKACFLKGRTSGGLLSETEVAMTIAVGCDHRGYAAKRNLLPALEAWGHQIEDFGCHSTAGVDYPDIAYPVAVAVASKQHDVGILIDSNGMGMSIVANKVHGVRAATVYDEFTARCAREECHCNIICLAADFIIDIHPHRIVEAFMLAAIATGRHARRIEKLRQIEEKLALFHVGVRTLPFLEHPPLATDEVNSIA